jgi:hypothetical protein
MHELGIVMHVAKTLDETAEEYHITKIGSVTLEVGEVSGIITDYFCDCWDYFKKRHPVLADSQLKIEITPEAKKYISDNGYDPVYGARPLKRYLQKYVETLSAKLILKGDIHEGDTILIDLRDGELTAIDRPAVEVVE